MLTRKEAISKAINRKKAELERKLAIKEKKIDKLKEENIDYKKICDEIKMYGSRLAITALSGNTLEIERLKERLNALNIAKEEIIKSSDIGDIKYECPVCKDTCYVDGKICNCINYEATKICLDELAKESDSDVSHFSNFDISLYNDDIAKNKIRSALSAAKRFVEEFNDYSKNNLLFMGETGLGKTHLSLAIANEIIKKEYDVLYFPAFILFSQIEKENFVDHIDKTFKNAVSCDLLIIDDLGGEYTTDYVRSVLYNIINTRLIRSKSTLINTNLYFEDLEKKYTARVTSRIIGQYDVKQFFGKDIRILNKLDK
ncbi:MAG: ATP-binding protein [Clostridia bacterium]|nr:ATP-binding protein [Clostridia bacterium]